MKRWQPAWIVFSIVVLFGLLPGCSDEGTPPSDATVPGRVSDLTVADVDDSTVTLAWTAPGDDGTAGTVASYEIRWLDSPVTEPDWSAGTSVGPVPEPTPAGTRQTARVRGVPPGRRRYLALKARDDAGNESFHSNVVDAQTGARVCHLEADTLDFGRTPVGLAFDLTTTITNVGGGTLRGTLASPCASFTLPSGGGALALRAGGRQTLLIRFTPTSSGPASCLLEASPLCAGPVCRGEGIEPEPIAFATLPFGTGSQTFLMGSPPDELGRDAVDERSHEVRLTRPLELTVREVTQAEWLAVMGWNDASHRGADRPAESLTWFDAVDFCNRLSSLEGRTQAYDLGNITRDGQHIVGADVVWDPRRDGYRLPTEAEWEFACRAGSTGSLFAGEIRELGCQPLDPVLDPLGWYCGNAIGGTRPAGEKMANPFGLQDTHGNVYEWCWDWYAPSYGVVFPPEGDPDPVSDPSGPAEGSSRICRGGAYDSNPQACRSAYRLYHPPGGRYANTGLRVARTLP